MSKPLFYGMTIKRATIGLAFLVVSFLSGCSMDRWSQVEPGEYVVASGRGTAHAVARQAIQKLAIDRDKEELVFTLADRTETVVSFVAREQAAWPSGCPSNINATRMEVLDITQDPLSIGSFTFSSPVLVRGCPPDPVQLVLREDGLIGGGGGACADINECVFFEQAAAAVSLTTPLPQSVKGYELYSSQANGKWYFTLVTGTNRLKDYEEITAGENIVTEDGWVRMTAVGVDGIKAVLDRLPPGASVLWSGPERQELVGGPVENLQLPPQPIIAEIQSHCQKLGIQLDVVE